MGKDEQIVTVFGATGRQGSAIPELLLKANKNFRVRAVTRDAQKPAAKALAQKGANVVECDVRDNKAVRKAVQGAWGVFLVTDYFSAKRVPIQSKDDADEDIIGKSIVDIAVECGVQHFVYSALPNATEVSHGKYANTDHFDKKAAVEAYLKSKTPNWTIVVPGMYYSMFDQLVRPAGDQFEFALPIPASAKLPLADITPDMGSLVCKVFENSPKTIGHVYVCSPIEPQPISSLLPVFKKITGKALEYRELDKASFHKYMDPFRGPIVSTDLYEMFNFYNDFEFGTLEGRKATRQLGVPITTWEDYLKRSDFVK